MLSQNKKILILVSIFILLIILLLLLSKYAFNKKNASPSPNLGTINNQNINTQDSKSLESVLLSLQASQTSLEKNSHFMVNLYLDSKNINIRGVDVYLKFDPKYLEVVDEDFSVENIQVIPGSLFEKPMILGNQANNSTGQIFLSINSLTPFNGKGIFGTIKFKTKNLETSTVINIEPDPKTVISKAKTDGQTLNIEGIKDITLTIK